jgi:hypothetical protein
MYHTLNKIVYIADDDPHALTYHFTNKISKAVTVQECLETKEIHKFPSCLIVDLGHRDIRFYVLHEYQILETTTLGHFGGSTLSHFLVKLIKENSKFLMKDDGQISYEIALDQVGRVDENKRSLQVIIMCYQE